MSGLTSSALERTHECLASTVLPSYPHSGIEVEHGNQNHADAENESKLHPKLREFLSHVSDIETEPSFVLNTRDRTVRRTGNHRAYGHLEWCEIGTTPDVIGTYQDGRGRHPIALDWKSRKRVTSANRNWQIRAQACAVIGNYGTAGIGYLDDGYLDLAEFGPIEIAAAWADLRELCERVAKVRSFVGMPTCIPLTPKRGSWCEYCPALLSCPAQKTALATFRDTLDMSVMVADASDADIEAARLTSKMLEKMLKQFDDAVRMRAEREPIKLANGKVLKVIQCSRSANDIDAIKERLRQHGEDPDQLKKTITYSQLKECKP